MKKSIVVPAVALGLATMAQATVNYSGITEEERAAHLEEAHIILQPIGGMENHFWFDYKTDVSEAKSELSSDLKRASDMEDLRDAWDEYRGELVDSRHDYVKEMGERYPSVTVID